MTKNRFLASTLLVGLSLAIGSAPARAAEARAAVLPDDQADDVYEGARDAIEQSHYDRAVAMLNRVIVSKSPRADAALYWKAYSLDKLGMQADALAAIADLNKQFASSRWLKDAKALEVEIRQSAGQRVSPDAQGDEELKLLALRGLMQSDPEQALPTIEKMLNGTDSPRVKERALFVLSQSRSPRSREIITRIAKGGSNPDLQLKAIRYLGMMHASADLAQIYQSETDAGVKKRILQAMFLGGDTDKVIELAKSERDPELRESAIRTLGLMRRPGVAEALTSIYGSDSNVAVKKAVVNAFFLQQNAAALVTLARAEKSVEMKKDIVSKLSLMKSKEATDYLMELLK